MAIEVALGHLYPQGVPAIVPASWQMTPLELLSLPGVPRSATILFAITEMKLNGLIETRVKRARGWRENPNGGTIEFRMTETALAAVDALRLANRLCVAEMCHSGTAWCVRRATDEEERDERVEKEGWAMSYEDARSLAMDNAHDDKCKWFDFSMDPPPDHTGDDEVSS